MRYPTKWQDLPPVDSEEARKAYCPLCNAEPGELCTYQTNKHNARLYRSGPCEHSHNDRRVQRSKDMMRELAKARNEALAAWLSEHRDIFKEGEK